MAKYKCSVCKYIYDEDKEKTKFSDLESDWQCPVCGAIKLEFDLVKDEKVQWECEILDIIEETKDTKTFHLSKPQNYNFIAGQHTLVSIPNLDSKTSKQRPFSFACSPTRNYLMFTIKKVGELTTQIHNLEIGSKLIITQPYGTAYQFTEKSKKELVCIAGGSGITPFKAILDFISEKSLNTKLSIFFANKTSSDIIYNEYFSTLDEINKNINIINIISNKEENWTGHTGYLNKEIIQEHIKDLEHKDWFVCGPPPMTKAIESLLKELNVKPENIFIEG
jgi:NAD(P)H-flavin reductase